MRDWEPRAGRHITLMVTQHGGSYQGTVQRSSTIPWMITRGAYPGSSTGGKQGWWACGREDSHLAK